MVPILKGSEQKGQDEENSTMKEVKAFWVNGLRKRKKGKECIKKGEQEREGGEGGWEGQKYLCDMWP